MTKAILGMMLLAGGTLFAAPRVSIGFSFGEPARVVRPACPGPGYTWIDGYNNNHTYVQGYWKAPVRVVAPVRHDFDRANNFDRGRDFNRNDRDNRNNRDNHDNRNDRNNRDFNRGFRR